MITYTIVFKYFFHTVPKPGNPSGLDIFALFLLCGLLPWNFFNNCVTGCSASPDRQRRTDQEDLLSPRLLPGVAVAAGLVSHLIEMGLLLVALLAFGDWRALVFVPLVLVLSGFLTLFGLGLGLLFSVINVYFRDVEHFTGILFMVWFYLTPILYSISIVPAKYHIILKINPITDVVLGYQAMWYNGRTPSLFGMSYFALSSVILLIVGLTVFGRLQRNLAEEL